MTGRYDESKERMEMVPKLIHTYQHHHLDSTRWAHFTPRDDDIVISTPYKSGTTWTQEIVLHLVFLGREVPYRAEVSPWLDNRFSPLEQVLSVLEEQRHRRCIKTHLALDGLPFYGQVKYIVVGRDPRDVCMSLWNHYASHTPDFYRFIIAAIVQQTSLTAMRARAEQHDLHIGDVWVNGARSFFYKGTNGRWKAVLSEEELAMYEHTAARVLTPACRTWLEQGRAGCID